MFQLIMCWSSGLVASSVQDGEKGNCKGSSHERRVSEEQNNESQKQKVFIFYSHEMNRNMKPAADKH